MSKPADTASPEAPRGPTQAQLDRALAERDAARSQAANLLRANAADKILGDLNVADEWRDLVDQAVRVGLDTRVNKHGEAELFVTDAKGEQRFSASGEMTTEQFSASLKKKFAKCLVDAAPDAEASAGGDNVSDAVAPRVYPANNRTSAPSNVDPRFVMTHEQAKDFRAFEKLDQEARAAGQTVQVLPDPAFGGR